MRTPIFLSLLIAGLLMGLSACGAGKSSANSSAENAPPPVSHTVFAPYIREIDKAKQVQNTVNAQKQALDQAIQAQTGGTSTAAPAAQS